MYQPDDYSLQDWDSFFSHPIPSQPIVRSRRGVSQTASQPTQPPVRPPGPPPRPPPYSQYETQYPPYQTQYTQYEPQYPPYQTQYPPGPPSYTQAEPGSGLVDDFFASIGVHLDDPSTPPAQPSFGEPYGSYYGGPPVIPARHSSGGASSSSGPSYSTGLPRHSVSDVPPHRPPVGLARGREPRQAPGPPYIWSPSENRWIHRTGHH